jgi:hypothetical protein
MKRHELGPRRSQSVDVLSRDTRVLAALALLALVGGIVSDAVTGDFWAQHALLASLTASVIVVMLSVAVINEVLDRRRRERWSVLAQFVMLELVRNARLVWIGILTQVELLPPNAIRPESVEMNRQPVRNRECLRTAVHTVISDNALRRGLRDEIAHLANDSEEILGRWATVMLSANVYAEVIDRHVELAGDMSWLTGLLDISDPPDDFDRRRRAQSNPAVEIVSGIDSDSLENSIVAVTQLAEELDRETLELARRIVPIDWWKGRLGASDRARAAPHRWQRTI